MRDTSALEKLADELILRVDELERENGALRKQASAAGEAAKAAAKPAACAVSEQTAEATVQALYKAGSLTADQLDESRRILRSDPEAAHRVLQKFLADGGQVKTAAGPDDNVSGGTLASGSLHGEDRQADCLDRMMRILRMD